MFNMPFTRMCTHHKRPVAMSDNRVSSGRNAAENCDGIESDSRPTPEEGRRLVHAFFEIRNADVREAVIRYVEEQSRLAKDG